MFSDIDEVGRSPESAFCVLSRDKVRVPNVDILWAGVSCRDVSTMNQHIHNWESRMDANDGSSANTLNSAMNFIRKRRPPMLNFDWRALTAEALEKKETFCVGQECRGLTGEFTRRQK